MGNGGTGGRASYASREKQMAAFDKLPPKLRAALANAYEDWAAYTVHQRWERGDMGNTADGAIRMIASWDATQRKRDRRALEKYLNRNQGPKAKRRGKP